MAAVGDPQRLVLQGKSLAVCLVTQIFSRLSLQRVQMQISGLVRGSQLFMKTVNINESVDLRAAPRPRWFHNHRHDFGAFRGPKSAKPRSKCRIGYDT